MDTSIQRMFRKLTMQPQIFTKSKLRYCKEMTYICLTISMPILAVVTYANFAAGSSMPGSFNSETGVNDHISESNNDSLPRTIMLDPDSLARTKQIFIKQNDSNVNEFLKKIIVEADSILSEKPTSVMEKNQTAPSDNKHDFYSLAAYEWPNPDTPDGLPYVSRDGKVNPEIYTISDRTNLNKMIQRVKTLAIANYFTDNSTYSAKAQELLRVWFLDKDTHMNPNLDYAEIEKGKGRLNPSGIMEGVDLPELTDAIGLLQLSPNWSKEVQVGMNEWFNNYLDWLLSSHSGKIEGKRMNNHGTYYNIQVSWIALYLNKTDFTKQLLGSMMQDISSAPYEDVSKLIVARINPDGSQPFELERATSLHYSMYNLLGLFQLASIGDRLGIDLWNYEVHGAGLKKALDFTLPYALDKIPWPYKQIQPTEKAELAKLSCQAIQHYRGNPLYAEAYRSVDTGELTPDINYVICDRLLKNAS